MARRKSWRWFVLYISVYYEEMFFQRKNLRKFRIYLKYFFCKWFSIRCHSIDSVYEDIMKTKQTDLISEISYNTIVNMSRMYANFAKSGSVFRYCCLFFCWNWWIHSITIKDWLFFFLLSDGQLLMESRLMDINQFEDAELVFLT